MARSDRDPDIAAGRDPDIVTAAELAGRLHLDVQTIRDLAAAEAARDEAADPDPERVTLHGWRIGNTLLFSWSAIYVQIAGPGIPDGEILDPAQLGRRLGVPTKKAWRALAIPGTPGQLPGRKVGKQWRSAWEAVHRQIRGPVPADDMAAGQAGSPAAR